ncbi:hypothetical protein N7476_004876 [Penicillium atrosanguineum]|uniref:Uncharacterized protein n=1 Tax=Penicillium atrosanguineum TaxID=1132637 RepID=A0A9W9PYD6_9EURO|nr:hypothetical protein N7526_001824 [Penicillium atrosanguineum]KAJ5318456.1 hypothetical protein N7476_004876 [Penicillium atrosanguineum]
MRCTEKLIWALSLLASPSLSHSHIDAADVSPTNANHIFNAIHSALRHWESGIKHNGVSFFLASVPNGTQFYHGTGSSQPINGIEWLAFVPEHALGFAHRSEWRRPHNERKRSVTFQESQHPLASIVDGQDHTDGTIDGASDLAGHGYLHIYAAAKDLRLLYVDGMSAGPRGSMQSQDRILFNDTIGHPKPGPKPPIGGPPREQERAIEACRMVKEVWGERIDGLVRTEQGFEIILCEFSRDLDVVHISQTKPQDKTNSDDEKKYKSQRKAQNKADTDGEGSHKQDHKSKPGGHRGSRGPQGDCCSLAARHNQLIGHKVRLDFDEFVTAYTYDLDLFPNNASQPVLEHIPTEQVEPIRRDINHMINTMEPSAYAFDWQAVADMIVTRYSDELDVLAKGHFASATLLRERLEKLLEPFLDYSDFNASDAVVDRCQNEFITHTAPVGTLGGSVVRSVSRRVCSTLVSGLFDRMDLDKTVVSFGELVSFLGWATLESK